MVFAATLLVGLNSGVAIAMPTYSQSLTANDYAGGGTAQAWTSDDEAWPVSLPFNFKFYDRSYSTAYVGSNGHITFDGPKGSIAPELATTKGIFAYGADLWAHRGGSFAQDIRVSTPASGQFKVTWNTETYSGESTTAYDRNNGPATAPPGDFSEWFDNNSSWPLSLPFAFPFYGTTYSTAYVSSNGYIRFGSGSGASNPSLATTKGIFPYAKALNLDCDPDGVGHTSSSSVVKVRWKAHVGSCLTGITVDVGANLYPDGRIEMLYGKITDTAFDQVAGISNGDSVNYITSPKDHAPVTNPAASSADVYSPVGGWPVNAEVLLKSSGEIRLRYGSIQDSSGSPQVGISRGDGINFQSVTGYDGVSITSNAQTAVLSRQASTTPPAISNYSSSVGTFSPNGNGSNETVGFTAGFNRYVNWTVAMKNAAGSTVKTYTGSGTTLSQSWDGSQTSGGTAPTGSYTALLTATDIDGVSSTANASVYLDRTGPTISGLTAAPNPFSPNADSVNDSTTISATLSDPSTPMTWQMFIVDTCHSGGTVRTFTGSGGSVSQVWNGKDGSGGALLDGCYNISFSATDAEGNVRAQSMYVNIDLNAPVISGAINATNPSFSPNGDAAKDTTTLSASLSDASPVTWTIQAKDPNGVIKRTFSGSGNSPSSVWNGKDELSATVPDDTYTVLLTATDSQGLSRTASRTVIVDTVAPTITGLGASPPSFSPNADGVKDTSTISATTAESAQWTLNVKNSSNTTVRTYSGTATGSVSQAWGGKDDSNTVVANGTYTAALSVTDDAGNAGAASTSLVLDTVAASVSDYAAAPNPFSPNGDGNKDSATLSATITDPSQPVTWNLSIKYGPVEKRSFDGSGSLSQAWDGQDNSGTTVADYTYSAVLTATDAAGNTIMPTAPVTVDTSAPSVSALSASNSAFSPNGDANKDTTTFSATASDASTPLEWTLTIRRAVQNTTVRTYTGTGGAISQSWDGKDELGLTVGGADYDVELVVTDDQDLSTTKTSTVTIDTVAPTVSNTYDDVDPFSPNGDGTKDATTFRSSFSEQSSSTILIRDASNNVVRTFTNAGLAPGVVQAWDGKNASSTVVADGAYTTTVTAEDYAGNRASQSMTTTVDTVAPTIANYGVAPNPFSPNGDGVKDSATFTATLTDPATPVAWDITIRNSANVQVKSFVASGLSIAQAWDGTDTNGLMLPSGSYTATLRAIDDAGNARTQAVSATIDLAPPVIGGLTASEARFSPNGDGAKDTTRFTASMTDASTPVSWTLAVKDAQDATVRTYTGQGSSLSQTWDGTDGSVVVPDGAYTVTLAATDTQGLTSTASTTVVVDTEAPTITAYGASPNPFSPNADAKKESTTFEGTLSKPCSWVLSIKDSLGVTKRSFSGSGTSLSATWNGKDSVGLTVPSGTYTASVSLTDLAGNTPSPFTTEVVVDTVAPVISGTGISEPAFSPNDDGSKDTTTITGSVADATAITWTVVARDGDGATVRSMPGSGTSIAQAWDGLKDDAEAALEGPYDLSVTATDGADNETTVSVGQTVIDLIPPVAIGLDAVPNPFSPRASAPKDRTTVAATLSESLPWTLRIKNLDGAVLKTLTGTGDGISYVWDGTGPTGDPVVDGIYQVVAEAVDWAGNVLDDYVYVHVGEGPMIASITPSTVMLGETLSITGTGFGAAPVGEHGVMVGDEPAEVLSWSDNLITALLPTDLQAGELEVTVWQGDQTSWPSTITLLNYVVPTSIDNVNLGYINVLLKPGASAATVAARYGDPTPPRLFPSLPVEDTASRFYQLNVATLTGITDTANTVQEYANDPDVEWAEFDATPAEPDAEVNDDLFGSQWGLEQSSDIDIDAKAAWDRTKGSTGISIAIIDSGIGPHPDLDAKLQTGRDYTGSGNTSDACSKSSAHGTGVASIASAVTNNDRGIAGIGWNTRLRAYKLHRDVYSSTTERWECKPVKVSIASVLDDAIEDGNEIINQSMGAKCQTGNAFKAQQERYISAWKAGVIIVASAGNDNVKTPHCPAYYKHVVAVGAIEKDGSRATGWGKDGDKGSNYGSWVETWAPGEHIRRAGLPTVDYEIDTTTQSPYCGSKTTHEGATYCYSQGTSAAAPFVSGTLALLRALNDYNVSDVSALLSTEQGSPARINANSALAYLQYRMRSVVTPDGAFIKDKRADRPAIYFLQDGKRRLVRSSRILGSWGLKATSKQIVRLDSARLARFPKGTDLGFRPGKLISVGTNSLQSSAPTWAITNDGSGSSIARWTRGTKRSVSNVYFSCLGYKAERVISVPQSEANLHGTGTEISECAYPNGAIIGSPNTAVYILQSGTRRLVRKYVYESWGMKDDEARSDLLTILTNKNFPDSALGQIGYRPGSFIQRDSYPLYFISQTDAATDFAKEKKREIYGGVNGTAMKKCYGFNEGAVLSVSSEQTISSHPTGTVIAC